VPGLVSAQLLGEARTVRLASGAIVAIDIAQILQRGELVVAMLGVDTPPFFQMKGEQLSGIDVTLAEQMAAELKVPLRVNRSGRSFNEVVEIVARGDADLYPRFGPTCEWDTAAGQAIVEAAGGSLTALDGSPLIYGKAASGFLNGPFIARGYTPAKSG